MYQVVSDKKGNTHVDENCTQSHIAHNVNWKMTSRLTQIKHDTKLLQN